MQIILRLYYIGAYQANVNRNLTHFTGDAALKYVMISHT